MRIVALIPARAGSKRVPGKNTKLLGGKPLIQWTIEAAQQAGIFSHIGVSTEDDATAQIAWDCGVLTWRRRWEHAQDDSPDIEWVSDVLRAQQCPDSDAFAILRPTSPFRRAQTIADAWRIFVRDQPADSLRTVRTVTEHPGKVWMCQRDQRIVPLLPYWTRTGDRERDTPWHSTPTQCLPAMHVQTGSLEIAWVKTVTNSGTIAGSNVIPYTLKGIESLDINTPDDWERAERHVAALQAAPSA